MSTRHYAAVITAFALVIGLNVWAAKRDSGTSARCYAEPVSAQCPAN